MPLQTFRHLRQLRHPHVLTLRLEQRRSNQYWSHVRQRVRDTKVDWAKPVPIVLGIFFIAGLEWYKKKKQTFKALNESGVTDGDSWYQNVLGALPLKTLSRLYGSFNSMTLPEVVRSPGYKLYSKLFGVNMDEMKNKDLDSYKSLQEFFMRELKEGVRPIDQDSDLVSPSDSRITFLGQVDDDGRIHHVKGKSYTVKALLSGSGREGPVEHVDDETPDEENERKDPIFTHLNNIHYTLADFLGTAPTDEEKKNMRDASTSRVYTPEGNNANPQGTMHRAFQQLKNVGSIIKRLGMKISFSGPMHKSSNTLDNPTDIPEKGNKLYCAVLYLAPGDYHRFHSPTDWIVDMRRHFAGELFSVSPWMVDRISDLFVLNERVALIGRWKYGFFSMVAVGATNVGGIVINFDKDLRTNQRENNLRPGSYTEAVYRGASPALQGQPLLRGTEMGAFSLGSTIVLIFEAPADFQFQDKVGDHVKVGERFSVVK